MSGAETVAGLVLGVLPLIISAAEYYKSTRDVLYRWNNYDVEFEHFRKALNVQECIFMGHIQLLLHSITGWDELESHQRLESGHDPEWVTSELKESFVHYLGESHCTAVISTIEVIKRELEFLKNKIEGLREIVENRSNNELDRMNTKAWFSLAVARLKISLSNPQFKERLTTLWEQNEILGTILGQVRQIREATTPVASERTKPLESIVRSNMIRTAGKRLYDALCLACYAHNSSHFLYLCLKDLLIEGPNPLAMGVDVALQPMLPSLSGSKIEPPIRFVVGTFHKAHPPRVREDEQDRYEQVDLTSNGKRVLDSLPIEEQQNKRPKHEAIEEGIKEMKEVEDIKLPDLPNLQNTISMEDIQNLNIDHSIHRNLQEREILSDLAEHRDFCRQVRACSQETQGELVELGLLNKRVRGTQLRVYTPRKATSGKTLLSLSDLLRTESQEKGGGGLLPHEIIYLAKRAAETILYFNDTELLPSNWSGKDIVFFDDPDGEPRYQRPHLKITISPLLAPNLPHLTRINNAHTFALGILLIELENQIPLFDLRERGDIVDGEEGAETRFSISKRVCEGMVGVLGARYREVVRKCIFCDFGKGFKFGDGDITGNDDGKGGLRGAFERDVVGVLGSLEGRFNR